MVNAVINIPCAIEDASFFKYWLKFLSPFHSLTNREMDVAASFLKHRYLLSKAISDADILDKVVMSEETRRKVREECKVTTSYFQVIMGKFKRTKFVVNDKLNSKLIPKNIQEGDVAFQLLLNFDLTNGGDSKEISK